jgi:hypothetical protein
MLSTDLSKTAEFPLKRSIFIWNTKVRPFVEVGFHPIFGLRFPLRTHTSLNDSLLRKIFSLTAFRYHSGWRCEAGLRFNRSV